VKRWRGSIRKGAKAWQCDDEGLRTWSMLRAERSGEVVSSREGVEMMRSEGRVKRSGDSFCGDADTLRCDDGGMGTGTLVPE
jgi:hypothetical protein